MGKRGKGFFENSKLFFAFLILTIISIAGCSSSTQKQRETYSFTEQCTACDSSSDCPGACDAACRSRGYDGDNGATGYDKKKNLGFTNEVTCTCRCYR